jgi:hypothetical protein
MEKYSPTPIEIEELVPGELENQAFLNAISRQGKIPFHGVFISLRELTFNGEPQGKWELRLRCHHLSMDQILHFYGLTRHMYARTTVKLPFSEYQGQLYVDLRIPKTAVPTVLGYNLKKEDKTLIQVLATPQAWSFNSRKGVTFFLTSINEPTNVKDDFQL